MPRNYPRRFLGTADSIRPVTSYVLRKAAPERTGTDVLVVGMTSSTKGPRIAPGGEAVASAFGRRLRPLLSTLGFEGKPGQTASVPSADQVRAPLVLVTGLGDEVTPTSVRRATGVAARAVRNAASVALALPADEPALVTALVEGYALGSYSFDGYRTKPESDRPGEVVILSEGARRAETTQAFEAAQVVAEAVARTRDWVNTPAADLRPGAFADAVVATNKARKATKGPGRVTVKVFDEEALADEGCGGILGDGRDSDAPPRMVRLTYQPADAQAHLALVGKGITFDSGGLSIKPGASMTTMKMDMAGAATVVNATFAIADLGLPVKVTTFAPMAENMLSGSATRPGDVLTMYGGRTVEVLNTDAEGRLVLADALVHAVEAKPDYVVDVATLTGACVIALGDRVAGLFGNDDAWIDAVAEAAEQAGEAVWRMPIPDEMGEKVRGNSKIADLAQHNTERWGGASYAAAFLREFVDGRPWTHIDIAGPAYNEKGAYGYVTPGGTGFGVATLVALAQDLAGG
jgi:leucyl aminopeptidase